MRESLTYLAIALILALSAALVAPLFIDWTDYRRVIEAQLSQSLGAPVSTAGPIKLRFLPTPQLRLGVVAAGERAAGPWLRAEGLKAELQLSALLRGEVRITEAALERPLLEITAAADGRLSLPLHAGDDDSALRIDHVSVHDGALVVRQPDGDLRIDGMTFDGEAQSLAGPYLLRGTFTGAAGAVSGAPVKFSLATGAVEKQRLRLRLGVDLPEVGGRADIDGALVWQGAETAGMAFDGTASFSGARIVSLARGGEATALPWKLTGALKGDLKHAALENFDLRAGEGERGLSASGQATLALGDLPHADVRLIARQLDLDRLGLLPAGASPAAVLETLFTFVTDDQRALPLALSVDFGLGASVVSLGGEALSDVELKLSLSPGKPAQASFSANGPGRSSLSLSGDLEAGVAAKFNGSLNASAPDAARLEDWFTGEARDSAWRRPAALAGYKSIAVSGPVALAATGFSGSDVTLVLDRSTYKGTIIHTRALGGESEKIYVSLASDLIDIDAPPDLSALAAAAPGADLSLELTARGARVALPGESPIGIGRIAGKLKRTGGAYVLEQLSLANAGAASISAAGAAGVKGSHIEARIDAAQMSELAALARRIAPGPWSEALAARAPLLVNTKLTIKADAGPLAAAGLPALAALSVDGAAGATKIAATARPDGSGNLLITAGLDAPDAAPLLRQLGLAAAGGQGLGAGRVNFTARKRGDVMEEIAADGILSGTALTYRGGATQGKATVKSFNIGPLLQVLGVAAPDAGKGAASGAAAEASADIALAPGVIDAQKITGSFAGSKFEGRLSFRPGLAGDAAASVAAAPPRLTGVLTLARASLGALASLALGPPAAPKPGALWPDTAFGVGLANLPASEIALTAAAFDLPGAIAGRDAAMQLRLSPGKISVEDFSVSVAGGKLGGHFDLRRDGPIAALSGQLTLDGVALAQPTLRARMSGKVDFASTGDNPQALAAGLAGGGEIAFAPLQIGGFDLNAMKRVIAAAEAEKLAVADQSIEAALAAEFDRAPFVAAPALRAPVTLAAGVLRFGPTALAAEPARAEASAMLDLRGLEFELHSTVAALAAPKYWSGAAPQANLVWKGVWPQLERSTDAAQLFNGLAAAAILRDSERLAAIDADIRERAFFNRRLKAVAQERERERQRMAAEQEAVRLAAEEEKRRIDEEKRKALEAARELSDQQRRQEQPRPPVAAPGAPVNLPPRLTPANPASAEAPGPRAN